jgi:hypothetical protein
LQGSDKHQQKEGEISCNSFLHGSENTILLKSARQN